MKRRPNSGTKSHRKPNGPHLRGAVDEPSDGLREILLDDEMREVLREQREAFRKKFGRDPEGDDPVFFDPAMDVPTLRSEVVPTRQQKRAAEALERMGLPPPFIHVFVRTGLLLSDDNYPTVSDAARKRWQAAVDEYFAWQRLAEEAFKAGAHPAIVYAISKTGKLRPESAEFSSDGSRVTVNDEDAAWMEAMNEDVEKYAESVVAGWRDPGDPGKDSVH